MAGHAQGQGLARPSSPEHEGTAGAVLADVADHALLVGAGGGICGQRRPDRLLRHNGGLLAGAAARVMAAQATLVTALAELGSMASDRLQLDRATILDPIANTLPEVETKQPALAREHRGRWWTRGTATQPTTSSRH